MFQNAALRALTSQLRLVGGVEAITLSDTRTLTAKDANILFLDPDGANRNVDLLAEDQAEGLSFLIKNTASGAFNLVVRDDAGSTVTTINQDEWALVACDGTTWRAMNLSALADYLATANAWTAAQTFQNLIFGAASELTIASGAVAATRSYHTIDTEADAASDDLDDITGLGAGELLLVTPAHTDRSVVLRHAIGANKIATLGARNITLAETTDWALLIGNGTQATVIAASTLADGILAAANIWTAAQALLDTSTVEDPADRTKKVRVDAGNVSAGATRVLAAPDDDIGLMGPAYVSTAPSTAITGATESKTAFSAKYTIPANTLKVGSVVHVIGWGIHTATTGAETSDLSLEFGAVSVTSDTGVDPSNSEIFAYEAWITVRAVGGVGVGEIVGYGRKRIGAVGTAEVPFILALSAIDTTIANDVAIYIDRQAAATDGDSAAVQQFVVEISAPVPA
jgi:hypothetical protein